MYMDRTTHEYPLTRFDVEQRNPDISSAQIWDDAVLAALNVYDVLSRESQLVPQYNQKVVEGSPIEINGQWYQNWILQPLSEEEYAQVKELEWQNVIAKQNEILDANVLIVEPGQVRLPPVIDYDYTMLPGNFNVVISNGTVSINDIQFNKVDFIINSSAYVPADNEVIVTNNLTVTSNNPIYYSEDVDSSTFTDHKITYFGNGVVMVTGTTVLPIDLNIHTVWTRFGKIPVRGAGMAIINDYGIFPLADRSIENIDPSATDNVEPPDPASVTVLEVQLTGNVTVSIDNYIEIISPYPKEEFHYEGQIISQEVYQDYLNSVRNITVNYQDPFDVVWPRNPLLENLNPPGPVST